MTWEKTAAQTAEIYRELAGDAVFVSDGGVGKSAVAKNVCATGVPFGEGRVAFVHDWLNGKRGGERVLEDLCDIWPLADIHTLFYESHRVSGKINARCIIPSALQHIPRTRRHYRHLLPLFPAAMRRMNLRRYDAVISISHCAAKAAPVPPGVPHICYCLTPARYFYDQAEAYFGDTRNPLNQLKRVVIERMRKWDQETAAGGYAFCRYLALRG